MRKIKSHLILRSLFGLSILSLFDRGAAASPPAGSNWGLTFADEFNNNTLDTMKWLNGYPWTGGNAQNGVITVNATVTKNNGNGTLNLIQTRQADGSFTGSAVATRLYDSGGSTGNVDMFHMTDGYIEASIKLPTHAGSWPAFWMLQGGWPPEIDIMEDPIFTQSSSSYGQKGYNTSYHYGTSGGGNASAGPYVNTSATATGFHTYGLQWTPTSLTFLLDGNVEGTVTAGKNGVTAAEIQQAKNMYILFTNGGGSWAGTPTQAEWPNGVSDQMQVDWVRVWENTSSYPATTTWTRAGNGSWTDTTSWSGGSAPSLSTQTAVFGLVATTNVAVTWNYSQTVGGLTFNSSTNYTLGSLTGTQNGLMLASPNGTGVIDSSAATGTNVINCRLELYNNVLIKGSSTTPLTINGDIIGSFSSSSLQITSGQVILNGAGTYLGNTIISGGSTLKLGSQGSLASGIIDVSAGILDVSSHPGFILTSGQTLRGNGSVAGAMTVFGTIEPGESPGILNTDDVTLGSGSILNIELAGNHDGYYDVLASSGSVVLLNGSELKLSFLDGFVPAAGDRFSVISFSSLSGTFSMVSLPTLPGGESWNIDSLYINGSVSVVPEPMSMLFLAVPAIAVGLRRSGARRH